MFSMDNDGLFPTDELAGAGYDPDHRGPRVLEQLYDADLLYDDWGLPEAFHIHGKGPGKWLYFPGQLNTDDPQLPLLISPVIEEKVIVLRIGGDAEAKPAAMLGSLLSSSPVAPVEIEVPVPSQKEGATTEDGSSP